MTASPLDRPVRVALVGAGRIAQAYADFLPTSESVHTVGVTDLRPDAAEAWARRASGVAVTDPVALLDLGPEVVVICTPPASHAGLARPFLRAGIAVLSEKPLAATLADAIALHEEAEASGAVLGMAAKFRFCPPVRSARALIRSGAIGPLRLVECSFTSRVDMGLRWNSRSELSGGGVIIDNGTHAIDLIRYLCGPVREVLATEQARPTGFQVEDTALVQLVTEDGVDASIDLSWSIDKSASDYLRVHGSDGEIRVGWESSAWRHFGESWQPLATGAGYAKLPAMAAALEQFCRAARRLEPPEVGGADAVADAAVVDSAYTSLRRGGWVKLDPLWRG